MPSLSNLLKGWRQALAILIVGIGGGAATVTIAGFGLDKRIAVQATRHDGDMKANDATHRAIETTLTRIDGRLNAIERTVSRIAGKLGIPDEAVADRGFAAQRELTP